MHGPNDISPANTTVAYPVDPDTTHSNLLSVPSDNVSELPAPPANRHQRRAMAAQLRKWLKKQKRS